MRMIVEGTKTTTGSPSRSFRILIMINYHPSFNDFDDEGRASQFNNNDDPEYFAYECLSVASVEKIFNDSIVINIQTESLPSLSSEYSLLGSEILAWSRPTCPQDVSSDDEKYICHKPLEITNVDHGDGLLLSPLLSPKDNPVTSRPQSLGSIQIFSIQ